MLAYRMPERLRPRLAAGFGIIIEGRDEEVLSRAKEVLRGCRGVIAVGDVVCASLHKHLGRVGCIIDGKTLRKEVGVETPPHAFPILRARNPRSHITSEAWAAVKELLRLMEQGNFPALIISGEEDLLVIPAVINAPEGYCIVYGMPGKGIGVVRVDESVREEASRILEGFEPVELPD